MPPLVPAEVDLQDFAYMRAPLSERAAGRWRSILPALGIDARHLNGKHGACPICLDGKDRFRFDDKEGRGTFICSHCGAGDGVALVMKAKGWSFKEAAERIENEIGEATFVPPKAERSEAENRQDMNDLWLGARPVQRDDPVGMWLAHRVGLSTFPACLRCHASALYAKDGARSWHPTMVAMLSAPDGSPAFLHRTFLTGDGQKANVAAPRLLMRGRVPKGSAVRLFDHDGVLGIAEGIETAFAAASLFGQPVWAATNATLLAQFEPPPEVRELIVFGDNDPKFGGAAAAYALAHRLAVRDRQTRVEIPGRVGADWADMLNEREAA